MDLLSRLCSNAPYCAAILLLAAALWSGSRRLCPFLRTAVLQGWETRGGRVTVAGSLAAATLVGLLWGYPFLAGWVLGAIPFLLLMSSPGYDAPRWGQSRVKWALALFMLPYAAGVSLCVLGANQFGLGFLTACFVGGMLPAFSNFSQAERKMGVDE